jgi:acetyl esterase/lipase
MVGTVVSLELFHLLSSVMASFSKPVLLTFLILFTSLMPSFAVVDTVLLTVNTQQGKVRGTTDKEVFVWRGIPYAEPPIGNLRMKVPQPPAARQGILDAIKYGASCPQPENSFTGDEPQNEDCLFLNIWSPRPDDKKRPVMVWIHGGGF